MPIGQTPGISLKCRRRAGGVGDRAFAAEFVKAPALAMAFIAERAGEAAGVEVRAARAVLVDHTLVGEFRTAEFVEGGSLPMVTYSRTTASRL